MEAGFTFLLSKVDDHLWVVISDPKRDASNVLVVSITTFRDKKDASCIIERGEHVFVTHRSCVAYNFAKVMTRDDYYRLRDAGLLKPQDPVPASVLDKIRGGAVRSPFLKNAHLNILKQQGLIGDTASVPASETDATEGDKKNGKS